MATHLPERKYFTFDELVQRWQCTPNDIRSAIVTGRLVPSLHIREDVQWAEWKWESDSFPPEFVATVRTRADGSHWITSSAGWLYLRLPYEVGPFRCGFSMLCTDPVEPPEPGLTVADWYFPPDTFKNWRISDDWVFMHSEVARLESQDTAPEKPLQTRERNVLLAMIATLAGEAGISLDQPSKAAELIESAAAQRGITLARTTILKKLKEIPEAVAARSR